MDKPNECSALVINAPEFFQDPEFVAWLNNGQPKFTWHQGGAPGDYSDVVVGVDASLNGEGTDSDMPEHIWDQIVSEVKRYHETHSAHWLIRNWHVMVRLTNLPSIEMQRETEKLMDECGKLFQDDRASWGEPGEDDPHDAHESKAGPRYLVAEGWEHIFEGFGARTVRFVYDRESNRIHYMETRVGTDWHKATAAQRADVEDSLKHGNEDALDDPDDYGLTETDELPDWSEA